LARHPNQSKMRSSQLSREKKGAFDRWDQQKLILIAKPNLVSAAIASRGPSIVTAYSEASTMSLLIKSFLAASLVTAFAVPAFAMDSMAKGGGMMIMSDGTMSTMKTMDQKASAAMMKHPMKSCVVMMMGADGKMYMMTETDKKCTADAKGAM
jgi:hypothetical protein